MKKVAKADGGNAFSTIVLVFCAAGAAVGGGVLGGYGISAPLLLYWGSDADFLEYAWLVDGSNLTTSMGIFLTTASLLGVFLLLGRSRIGNVGVICAALSLVAFLVLLVDELLGSPLTGQYFWQDDPSWIVEGLLFVSRWGRRLGLLFLGLAVLRTDVVGRWRFLLLAICAVEIPVVMDAGTRLSDVLLSDADEDSASILLFGLPGWRPGLIACAGWVLVGYILLLAGRELGRRRAEEAARAVEESNRVLARRMYAEAWENGDFSVLDELVSQEFLNQRQGGRGPEGYGRAIEKLRRTFPDLSLSIAEQRAEGDTVTTGCILSGTDRGGVLWYPPTGRAATFTGTFTDRFSEGKIVEHNGETDTAGLLRQLGLPATPVSRRHDAEHEGRRRGGRLWPGQL